MSIAEQSDHIRAGDFLRKLSWSYDWLHPDVIDRLAAEFAEVRQEEREIVRNRNGTWASWKRLIDALRKSGD